MKDMIDPTFPMNPQDLAREIDLPLENWPGNCHGVATLVRDLVPVEGMRLARGHYAGPISRSSVYRGGIAQHSWLVLADGRILDPTRWALETPETPFVYLGPCDHYDEGGRALAASMPPAFPGQGPDHSARIATLCPDDRRDLARLLGRTQMSDLSGPLQDRVRRDPDEIEEPASLYALCARMGLKAIVPIDNWMRIMEPETLACRPGANRLFSLPPAEDVGEVELIVRLLSHFVTPEAMDLEIERVLGEHDIDLMEYLDALDTFRGWGDLPLKYLPCSFVIGIAMTDLLGHGYGEVLRVERYAASLGYDRAALDRAFTNVASEFGLNCGWT